MDLMSLMRARYSVRNFSERPVEDEKLAQIIEAGLIAPTARNNQCPRVYVLKSPEALEKARALTSCAFNAPIVLLFCYMPDEEFKNPFEEGFTSGDQDASIVATHMMLEAFELGIGSCWVDRFPPRKLCGELGISEKEVPVLLMPMGYPAEDSVPAEKHFLSRPRDEIFKFL